MFFGRATKAPWVVDALEGEVAEVVGRALGINPAKVHVNAIFGDDLGVASLDYVDLEIAFEQHFGVPLEGLLISEELSTVRDVVQYLRPRLALGKASRA